MVVRRGLPRITLLHQPFHGASGHIEAFAPELTPDLARAIDREVLGKHAGDLRPLKNQKALGFRSLALVVRSVWRL
jgi:hypothetical protein